MLRFLDFAVFESFEERSILVHAVGVKMVGCPVRVYRSEVIFRSFLRMPVFQGVRINFDSLKETRESNPQDLYDFEINQL